MDITLQMRSLELMLKMIKHDMSGVPPYGYRRQKYDPPADSTLSLLPRCTPEEAGLSSPAVERFFAAGVPITVGSDAHHQKYVGSGIKEGYQLIQAAGFDYITTFENRRPKFIKL